MTIKDPSVDALAALAKPSEWEYAATTHMRIMDRAVRERVARPDIAVGQPWDQPDLHQEFLRDARLFVEGRLIEQAARFSPFRWLWYLRRIPHHIFAGQVPTTFTYDVSLAEAVSARSRKTGADAYREEEGSISYRVKSDTVQPLLEFCAGVIYLSQIHTDLRWSGKGFLFAFDDSGALPRRLPTREQEAAVRLFDQRMAQDGNKFLTSAGTWTGPSDPARSQQREIAIVGRLFQPQWGPSFAGSAEPGFTPVTALRGFHLDFIPLSNLAALNSDRRLGGRCWWDGAAPSLIALLRFVPALFRHVTNGILGIHRYGYLLVPRPLWDTAVNEMLPDVSATIAGILPNAVLPADAGELLRELATPEESLWPSHTGPAVRIEGELVAIDLGAATNLLNEALEFAPTGGAGHARGMHFEKVVQDVINDSPWAPDARTLRYARDIREGDNVLTDIDAVGARGDRLLLVSCKSRSYTKLYDAGERNAIQNTLNVITGALTTWRAFRAYLNRCRVDPALDRYGFGRFPEVILTVCLPHVFYVPTGPGTEAVAPGLRAVVSLGELQRWMNR